jgi:hypothetical protein
MHCDLAFARRLVRSKQSQDLRFRAGGSLGFMVDYDLGCRATVISAPRLGLWLIRV